MLKYITSGVAAVGVAVGSYGFGQYHKVYVELNQAQAQVRDVQTKNADLASAASGVVSAVSQLQEALARDQVSPGSQAQTATAELANTEHVQ
jgi:hypothetical protein